MYNDSAARVKAIGLLSKPFQVKRGVKQGDPLSPQIFALCIEPLAECIRTSMGIKGIKIQDEEHKLASYANDVIIFLTDIYKSLPALLEEIGKYGAISGYKLNSAKTEAMEIGCNLQIEFKKRFKLKWDQNKIKYLGITIPREIDKLYLCNYKVLENSLRQDLLPLTIFETIQII